MEKQKCSCKYCGAKNILFKTRRYVKGPRGTGFDKWQFYCKCGVSGPLSEDPNEAEIGWNKINNDMYNVGCQVEMRV